MDPNMLQSFLYTHRTGVRARFDMVPWVYKTLAGVGVQKNPRPAGFRGHAHFHQQKHFEPDPTFQKESFTCLSMLGNMTTFMLREHSFSRASMLGNMITFMLREHSISRASMLGNMTTFMLREHAIFQSVQHDDVHVMRAYIFQSIRAGQHDNIHVTRAYVQGRQGRQNWLPSGQFWKPCEGQELAVRVNKLSCSFFETLTALGDLTHARDKKWLLTQQGQGFVLSRAPTSVHAKARTARYYTNPRKGAPDFGKL